MRAAAFALFLIVFYCLPLGPLLFHPAPPFLFQWVWQHAPQQLPSWVFRHQGHLVWNGAFYLEMLGYWGLFLLVGWLFEWIARQDDAEWGGLGAGFARRAGLRVPDLVLALLFPAFALYAFLQDFPVYGLISAGIPVVTTLSLPSLMALRRKARAPGKSSAALRDAAPTGPTEPASPTEAALDNQQSKIQNPKSPDLALEARPLKDEEPRPIRFEALVEKARQAVVADGAPGLVFCEYTFTPPDPPDPRLAPEGAQQLQLHIEQAAYLAALSRPRPADPPALAAELASAVQTPVLHRAAEMLFTPNAEPRYNVRKTLAFVDSLAETPALDGHARLPVECLHDKAATSAEKAGLTAALLQAGGQRTALWHQKEAGKDWFGVAIANLYDPSNYIPATPLRAPQQNTVWLLCRASGFSPDPSQVRLYDIAVT